MKALRSLVLTAMSVLVLALPAAAMAEGEPWHVNGVEIEEPAEVKGSGDLTFRFSGNGGIRVSCQNVSWEGVIYNIGEQPEWSEETEGPNAYASSVQFESKCSAEQAWVQCEPITVSASATPEFPWMMEPLGGTSFSQSGMTFSFFPVKNCPQYVGELKVTGALTPDWSNKDHAFVYEEVEAIGNTPQVKVDGALTMETIEGGVVTLGKEATPPDATTEAANEVTATAATLHGIVDPNGSATEYRFVYGTSPGVYGKSTSSLPVEAMDGEVLVNAKVSSLAPSQTYYYRVIAENAGGTDEGKEMTFKTSDPYWHVNGSEIEEPAEVEGNGNLTFYTNYSALYNINCSNVTWGGIIANLEEGPFAASYSVKFPSECSASVGGSWCSVSGTSSITEEAPWYLLGGPEPPNVTFTFTETSCAPGVTIGGKKEFAGTLAGKWNNESHAVVFNESKGLGVVGTSSTVKVSGSLPMKTTGGGVVTQE